MFSSLEDAWDRCEPADLVWAATREGVLTDRELRLFGVYCARSAQHLLTDPRSIAAIEVAERYANGDATKEELEAAVKAAYAAEDAVYYADTYADTYADDDAINDAAYAAPYAAANAAYDAAYAAAYAAPYAAYAAAYAAYAAAYAAARDAQAAWLRQNTTPNFN